MQGMDACILLWPYTVTLLNATQQMPLCDVFQLETVAVNGVLFRRDSPALPGAHPVHDFGVDDHEADVE